MSILPCTWQNRPHQINIHLPTGCKFGKYSHDSNNDLRKKHLVLLAAYPTLVFLPRLLLRTYYLMPHSIQKGYQQGTQSWTNKRVTCFLNQRPEDAPGHFDRAIRISFFVLWNFFKDLVKLIALPFASALMVAANIWGLIFPQDGRFLFSAMEDQLSIGITDCSFPVERLVDHSAVCMQPKHVFERENWFRHNDRYHPGSLRSTLLSVQIKINNLQGYFSSEDYLNLKNGIKRVNNYVHSDQFPFLHRSEVTDEGNLRNISYNPRLSPLRELRSALYNLSDNLIAYKACLEVNNPDHLNWLGEILRQLPELEGMMQPRAEERDHIRHRCENSQKPLSLKNGEE